MKILQSNGFLYRDRAITLLADNQEEACNLGALFSECRAKGISATLSHPKKNDVRLSLILASKKK